MQSQAQFAKPATTVMKAGERSASSRKGEFFVHHPDACVNTALFVYWLLQVCVLRGVRDVETLFGDVDPDFLVNTKLIKTFGTDVCIFSREDRKVTAEIQMSKGLTGIHSVHDIRLLLRQACATRDWLHGVRCCALTGKRTTGAAASSSR